MRAIAILLLAISISACQPVTVPETPQETDSASMSIKEARQISADFKNVDFVAPPRTANDLKKIFSRPEPIPADCQAQLLERQSHFEDLSRRANSIVFPRRKAAVGPKEEKRIGRIIASVGSEAENQIAIGRFDLAIELLQDALKPFEARYWEKSFPNTRGEIVSRLARIHARLGNIDEAEQQQIEFERLWTFRRAGESKGTPSHTTQTTSVKAELAFANGDLQSAEAYFRKAVEASHFTPGVYGNLNNAEMRAGLIRSLILQRRLSEAEAAAREAVTILRANSRGISSGYRAEDAAPVVALADVFLEQGRPEDAEFVARAAINILEYECSAPESLGLTAARLTLVQVLADQGKWDELLLQINKARDALQQFPELFQLRFGESLERIEAEIRVGDAAHAKSLLEKIAPSVEDEYGKESYQVAEIDALIAMSQARSNDDDAALKVFASSVPILLEKAPGIEAVIGTTGRRGRIIEAYVRILRKFVERGQLKAAGIDVVSEMLRVSAFHREAKVGQAFSAGYLRASVGDAELAALIRQEQDIAQEMKAVGEILAYASNAGAEARRYAATTDLEKRLQTLRLAWQSLRGEVLRRFPDFAALTTPSPMTANEMRSRLGAKQSLIVFHVADDAAYVWAVPAEGDIAFAVIPMKQEDLAEAIHDLRKAVDPGLLRTLDDIPPFDVELANALYRMLLEPVKKGWKDASELVVVANGPLGTLPVSMLVTKLGKGDDGDLKFSGYRQVAWLGKQVDISYLPSVNALKNLGGAARDAEQRPFVGFGDPYFNTKQAANARGENAVQVASRGFSLRSTPLSRAVDSAELTYLPRLPDTRDEILAVANLLGADVAQDVYLGERASKSPSNPPIYRNTKCCRLPRMVWCRATSTAWDSLPWRCRPQP